MNDTKQINPNMPRIKSRKKIALFGVISVLILIAGFGASYFIYTSRQVTVDRATISAPLIHISPTTSGRLNAVYVNEGDRISANTPVALIGTQVIKTKTAGLVVKIHKVIGAQVTAGTPIVTILNPSELRVVGKIDENKGLANISVGDFVTFTVDAFGSKKYRGVVDEISPTSERTDVVFSISDKRPTNQFAVYVRFNPKKYMELKNGMSARIYIHKS